MNSPFDIAPKDWKEKVAKTRSKAAAKEDIEFLTKTLNGEIPGIFAGIDMEHEARIRRMEQRATEESKRAEKAKVRKEKDVFKPEDFDNEDAKDINDNDFTINGRQQKKPSTFTVKFSRNLTDSSEMTALADNLKLSNQQYFALTAGLLKAGGAKESEVNLSKTTVLRNREKNRQELAAKLMKEFASQTKEEVLTLHWDEKIMTDLDGVSLERLIVIVSSKSVSEGKVIAAMSLEEGIDFQTSKK